MKSKFKKKKRTKNSSNKKKKQPKLLKGNWKEYISGASFIQFALLVYLFIVDFLFNNLNEVSLRQIINV